MDAGTGEFRELHGPYVAIVDVPALVCASCGSAQFAPDVMRRLAVILAVATDLAAAEGRREVVWTYTPHGPPELGGLALEVWRAMASLADAIELERRLLEATNQAGQPLGPRVRIH